MAATDQTPQPHKALAPQEPSIHGPRTMASATRKVLAWRLSNSLDASFCLEALEEALAAHEPPEIMNTDQSLPRA